MIDFKLQKFWIGWEIHLRKPKSQNITLISSLVCCSLDSPSASTTLWCWGSTGHSPQLWEATCCDGHSISSGGDAFNVRPYQILKWFCGVSKQLTEQTTGYNRKVELRSFTYLTFWTFQWCLCKRTAFEIRASDNFKWIQYKFNLLFLKVILFLAHAERYKGMQTDFFSYLFS